MENNWSHNEASAYVRAPRVDDDKYRRGVLGVVSGSDKYPGAAVLGVEAALHTGVGMLRYLGPQRAADLVLQRRPETVTAPGRVQAWLLGSGTDVAAGHSRDERVDAALADGLPTVLDAGALELFRETRGLTVMTPHHGELARIMGVERSVISSDPVSWAARASDHTGATVLLKGPENHVAGPGTTIRVGGAPSWLATAGAGDALAGILGALLAVNADLLEDQPREAAPLAATAAYVHAEAARRASAGGPLTILDLCAEIPAVIAELAAR